MGRHVRGLCFYQPSTNHFQLASKSAFFESLFGLGSLRVMTGFGLIMAFADLGFDLFCDEINSFVEVFLAIFRKQVWTAHTQSDGAGELCFGSAGVVVFECDASVNDALIKMFNAIQFVHHVIFDCLGQRDMVSVKNQFHIQMMLLTRDEIQRKNFNCRYKLIELIIFLSACLKIRTGARTDSDGVRPSSSAAT